LRVPTLARTSSPAYRLCPAPVRAGGHGPPPDDLAPCPPNPRHAPLRARGPRATCFVDARLHASASGDEIWVAIATQAVNGCFVDERLRDVFFRLVFDAAGAETKLARRVARPKDQRHAPLPL
jgi:hypothetical protein